MKKSFPLPVDLSEFAWYENTADDQSISSLGNTFDINPYRAKPGKNADMTRLEPSGLTRAASQMAFGTMSHEQQGVSQKDLQILLHARAQRLEKALRRLDVPAGNARNMQRDASVINRNARAPFQSNRTGGMFNTNRNNTVSGNERWDSIPEAAIGNLLSIPASFAHRGATDNMYSYKRNATVSDEDFDNPDIHPDQKWKVGLDGKKVAKELPLQLVSHLLSGIVGGWGGQFDLLSGRRNKDKTAYDQQVGMWDAGKADRRSRKKAAEKAARKQANQSGSVVSTKMPDLDAWGRIASGPFGIGTKAGGWRPIWDKDTNQNTLVHTHDARWNDSNGSWEMAPRGTGKAEAANVAVQDIHAEPDMPWTPEIVRNNEEHKLRLDHHVREGNLFLDDDGFVSGKNPDYIEAVAPRRRGRPADMTTT